MTSRSANFAAVEALMEYILQFGDLDKQQLELVAGKAREMALRKEAYFSEAGKISPRQVGFLMEGVVRGTTTIIKV